jgi:hypothetical protein
MGAMSVPFLAGLDPGTRDALLDELNYLNTAELRRFCRRHGIPSAVHVRLPDGRLRRTGSVDRKAVVVDRVRRFLLTGEVPGATVIPASVVSEAPLPEEPRATDRLCFGCYDKHHAGLMAVLRGLTGGRFRNGAVARLLCMEYWTRGEAPTLADYASAWLVADERGLGLERGDHPEAAYLTDRARGRAGADWKRKRAEIAARVLTVLDRVPPPGPL